MFISRLHYPRGSKYTREQINVVHLSNLSKLSKCESTLPLRIMIPSFSDCRYIIYIVNNIVTSKTKDLICYLMSRKYNKLPFIKHNYKGTNSLQHVLRACRRWQKHAWACQTVSFKISGWKWGSKYWNSWGNKER